MQHLKAIISIVIISVMSGCAAMPKNKVDSICDDVIGVVLFDMYDAVFYSTKLHDENGQFTKKGINILLNASDEFTNYARELGAEKQQTIKDLAKMSAKERRKFIKEAEVLPEEIEYLVILWQTAMVALIEEGRPVELWRREEVLDRHKEWAITKCYTDIGHIEQDRYTSSINMVRYDHENKYEQTLNDIAAEHGQERFVPMYQRQTTETIIRYGFTIFKTVYGIPMPF